MRHLSSPETLPFIAPAMPGARIAMAVLCAMLVILIATADYATGYDVSLSVLYIGPVLLAAWIFGAGTGVFMSFAATAVWYLMFVREHPFESGFYHGWEALIRVSTYALFAVLTHRLHVALAYSDRRFVAILEGLNAVVFVSRPGTGELLYLNEQCRLLYGPGPLRRLDDMQPRLENPPARPSLPESGAAPREVHEPATGRWHLVDVRAIPWIDGDSAHLHVVTDITSHKRTEQVAREQQQQLDSTSRLIAVGEMASTLAHELNQPLAAILNYNTGCLELLQSGSPDLRVLSEGLERSSEQAERAGRIVQQVRDFIRTREPRLEPCDFNALVVEATRAIERDARRYGVPIAANLAPDIPAVQADRVMLQQLLINLAKNAIEAMEATPAAARELSLRSYSVAEAVHFEIADRGGGLPAAMTENLFIPFFSTKRAGMGLGLQICRSAAEFHAARLSAAPRSGGGTVFHLILPARRS